MSKIPLDDIVYKRYNSALDITFFIREHSGRRNYPREIKKRDKLYKIGIWEHKKHNKNNRPAEFPFSFDDQAAMLKVVCNIFVKKNQRVNLIKKFLKEANGIFQLKLKKT